MNLKMPLLVDRRGPFFTRADMDIEGYLGGISV